ncbi:hypothetical protein MN116_008790 [Schistosoma mekongi]|uniref:Uncharacterized protein n=1 Tax=Schistosoma mekongi TaxID=38744 RepID=A0AAE1Z5A7_SCHME|nr:hypothetical protein MN116_008790 [Schistosoma mekongi]
MGILRKPLEGKTTYNSAYKDLIPLLFKLLLVAWLIECWFVVRYYFAYSYIFSESGNARIMITPSDDNKQVKLVIRVRISVIVFWLLSIVFLIIGITVLSMYHNLNESIYGIKLTSNNFDNTMTVINTVDHSIITSSQYAGTIAGTFFLVLSVPLIICSSCLTSALLIIQESIQDERDYRCRDPEFYKDIPYPRQPFKPVPSTSLLPTPYPSAPMPLFQDRSKLFLPTDQQYGVASPPSYHSAVTLTN